MEARTSTRAKEMLCNEIEKIVSEGNLKGKLELLHMLTDTLKNLFKIEMYEQAEQGYSRDGGSYRDRDRRYSRDNSMDSSYGGNSYDYSGRRHLVRAHYSRDDGREEFMDKLDDLMNDAPTEKDREAVRRCMNLMQNA